MKITLTYSARDQDTEDQAELYRPEEVEQIVGWLTELDHEVTPLDVHMAPADLVDALLASQPELVFNLAEGRDSSDAREARYPAIFEQMGLPHTGGGASLLLVDLDKRLSERILAARGVRTPAGTLLRPDQQEIPDNLAWPLFVKPNFEGSGKGISGASVLHDEDEARRQVTELLRQYPQGVVLEEFIEGRDLTVPMLEAWPGGLLGIVEGVLEHGGDGPLVLGYEEKQNNRIQKVVRPSLTPRERQDVLAMADRTFQVMPCPDLGRADLRLRKDGVPFLLEVNPLPSLLPTGSFMAAARAKGLDERDVVRLVVLSAARRYGLSLAPRVRRVPISGVRPTARELGVTVGCMPTGRWNAITDVEGVKVGHTTHIRDERRAGSAKTRSVRTGITAIVPDERGLFDNHLVAGGFVLNGIGEMSGLTQTMEWGWLETPILLTNTMSVGLVHTGIVQHMIRRHPHLGRKVDVIIPVVAETNDSFLNDVRILPNTPEVAMTTIESAAGGPVPQGSVGGGTGMLSFDFAGGIGTSSRVVESAGRQYTIGVLVQSNFGRMRNLTMDGAVVGRDLDPLFPMRGRRKKATGSVIVVVATDAPLLSAQLSRLAKRAALGLARVGSFAASTSGEFVVAFSTGNRTSRAAKEKVGVMELTFVTDEAIDPIYEGVVEATEEAVLNAIFCSSGMTGRLDRYAPPLPVDAVLHALERPRRREAPAAR